ncbi:hypothetical protein FQZ97_500910 [compost metagenome]
MRSGARHQRLDVSTTRQGAVNPSALAEAAGDEGVGHRGVAGFQQQLGLQRHGHVFGELAGAVLDVAGVREALLQIADEGCQARIAVAVAQFGEECIEHSRFLGQGAQHVQALHVARTFPGGVDRGFAVQAREDGVFDVAGAAQAFGGLVDHRGGTLADPVLAHGGDQAGELVLLLVVGVVQGAAHAHGQGQRGFAFQRQVGQHVLHQRLLGQHPSADLAVGAVVGGLGQGLTHQGAGADHAVETGQGDHFDDGRHPATFFAHHPGQGAAVLHLAGGVGPVAQLVLQALDVELVAAAVRAVARQQEAGQPLVGVGQGEEGVAHGRRAEPLVADQFVGLARAGNPHRVGAGGVGAHVGAALLLGHGHADGDPGLLLHGQVARVVFAGKDLRQPLLGDFRLQAQGRHAGEGHGQRATRAGLGLAVQVAHAGAGHLGAGAGIGPGHGGDAVLDRGGHQFVVGRVELHQVDAVAIAVMALEYRLVLVGEEARRHQRTSGQGAIAVQALLGPAAMEATHPLLQRQVDAVEVGAIQWRHLVEDFMGFSELVQAHRRSPGQVGWRPGRAGRR